MNMRKFGEILFQGQITSCYSTIQLIFIGKEIRMFNKKKKMKIPTQI